MRDTQPNYQRQRTDRFNRVMDWLSNRPMESWLFFAAGVIIARILF